LQPEAQFGARAQEARFRSWNADVQCVGYISYRQFLNIAKHQHVAQQWWDSSQFGSQNLLKFSQS
jgi:hypothetical protein